MRKQKRSRYQHQDVALTDFEATEKTLGDRVFAVQMLFLDEKEESFVAWGYDIIEARKKHLGTFSEIRFMNRVGIQSVNRDKEGAVWIFFTQNYEVDDQMPNKRILRVG